MTTKTCAVCAAFVPNDQTPEFGQCRRHSPQTLTRAYVGRQVESTVSVLEAQFDTMFPITHPTLWCGDFISGPSSDQEDAIVVAMRDSIPQDAA